MKKEISFEDMNAALRYDPETGLLWWKERASGRRMNVPAGGVNKTNGYVMVRVNDNLITAHRIAYLLYYGSCPTDMDIDHINHVRTDNRIKNLRVVSPSENSRNASLSKGNTTGATGVSYHKPSKKFMAHILICGKKKYLGIFDTIEEAAAAREKANEEYGFHRNHGK